MELAKREFDKVRLWAIVLLVAIASILAYGIALLNQNIDEAKKVSQQTRELARQNDRFVDNFSNYMSCLIVNEDEVVIEVGEEAYVEICKQLLYRGITPIPPTIKPDSDLLPKPGTTTTTEPESED